MTAKTWDYEGYWNAVIGRGNAASIVGEFDLDPTDRAGLDEWLGKAEAESWRVGDGYDGSPIPAEWAEHHEKALEELCAVTADE